MKLELLLKSTKVHKVLGYIKNIDIKEISTNSHKTKVNSLFIAQKGRIFDGHDFLEEAVLNGAVALVVEKENPNFSNIPQIIVENTRQAVCTIASEFYGNPKDRLKFVGVTGTNGKTSCTLFLSEILKEAGKKSAVIGTLGIMLGDKFIENDLTTPDPIFFHKILKDLADENTEYVVMEVSAHALYFEKLCNIKFEAGILTNITQDHLDFFKTMKSYARAKLTWFLTSNVKMAVINADDYYSRFILNKKINYVTYGLNNPSDVFAVDIHYESDETNFYINIFDNVFYVENSLVGEFNVYNVLAVMTCAVCLGINFATLISAIKKIKAPSGRFNCINFDDNKSIVVDFAHTPDSLKKVLITARNVCKGRLLVLFGCGGDRDKIKRPIMGKIGEEYADFMIITSDNPRFERPEDILKDIEKGISGNNYFKIPDRKMAIEKLLSIMQPNDFAVICGKGGELYQDINGVKIPYNDFDEIEKYIQKGQK